MFSTDNVIDYIWMVYVLDYISHFQTLVDMKSFVIESLRLKPWIFKTEIDVTPPWLE